MKHLNLLNQKIVATCRWLKRVTMILAVFLVSIGQMWGTDFTFSGAYNGTGNGSWNTTTSTTPIVTVTKSISNTSKSFSCINSGTSFAAPSLNSATAYIKFAVPTGYRITNVNVTWMANTSSQKIIAIFGESLSDPTSTSNVVTASTKGGYILSNALASSGNTTCDGGEDFAISSSYNAKEVMLVRQMAYNATSFPSASTNYSSFACYMGSAQKTTYTTAVGNGSSAYIGKVVLTVEPTTTTKYTLAYDANGGSGSMPAHEFVSGTTVYAGQNAGFTPPTGKIFKCWNTEAEGGGTEYKEGDSFTLSANTTLYAQWITASTGSTYCINMFNLNVSGQMKYFTYSGYDDMQILDLEVPDYQTSTNNFWVGKNGSWYNDNLGNSNAKSANEMLQDLCLKGNRSTKLGTSSQGVLARFFVYDNSWQDNLYIEFTPKQYSLIWGPDGSSWSPVKLYPSGYENEWTSEVVTLTSDQISSYNYYVGILKADNGVAYWYKSNTLSVGSMGTYNKPSDSWGGNVSTLSAGDKGFFRMWSDATSYDNWRCHFVPVYTLSYNANSGTGAPANAYTATEGDAAARTLKVSTTEPTRNGYSFEGWAESSANASAGTVDYAPGASITLSADQELWAVWECVDPTIGTDLSESQVDKYVGDASPTLTVAATAAGGSVSYQWYSNTAKSTTSPTPTALTNCTTATYNPSTAAAGTTYYFCKITNSTAGCSNVAYSKIAKIVVSRINPTQYTVSGTASICAGGNTDITLSSSQVGASYQLKIGGSATGDAKAGTGSALTWNVSATGTYTVSAVQTTKYLARDMSGSATVSSKTATSVSFSDYTLDATEGESFEITGISAAGSGTLTYQWYSYTDAEGSGEDDIDGATSSTYTFTPASTGDYYFKCKVTGDCGSVKSDMITVTAATACSTPADPDGLAAGSISSSGVTFTITDDESPASYEIYYSTSSTAPTGSTVASTTTTSTTKAVTGLTANTTYYAWVRAVCNDDYKSDWVALTGSTFTTLAAGTKYYLFTPTKNAEPAHTGTLSGQFRCATTTPANNSQTIDGHSMSHWCKFSTQTSLSGGTYYHGKTFIAYDIKTNSTDFTLYFYNNASAAKDIYYALIQEGITSAPTPVKVGTATANSTGKATFTITASKNTRILFYTEDQSNMRCHQIVAEESGSALPKPGTSGYKIGFKGTYSRFSDYSEGTNKQGILDDSVKVVCYSNYSMGTADALKIHTSGTDYISFRTGASACQVKVCVSSSKTYYLGTSKSATTNEQTSTHTFALAANTRYYINPNGSDVTVDSIVFLPAAATTYTVSITADPDGYGTVSSSSVTSVASGTTLSTSTNTLSVGATDVTASATFATAEYTYAFSNWTKSDGTALPSTVTADLSVYANFTRTANNYTLTWNTNGGSDLECDGCTSGSTAYGASITAPTDPTLSNYTFDGWKTNNDGTGTAKGSTMPAANTTYYAAWKQTVTLTTGAQGSGGNQTPYVYLNGTGVSSFTPHTASGYTLNGYYTASTGGTKVLNADGTFAASAVTDYITSSKWSRTGTAPTLYAQWRAAAGKTCYTWDAEETHPQTGTTNYDGLYLTATTKAKKQANSALTDTIYDVSNNAKSLTGHINGAVIDSLIFGASTSDSRYTTFVVSFCSTQTFDTAKIIKVGGYHCTVYNVALNTAAASLTKIKAPAGTKSFVLSRNYMSDKLTSSASLSNNGSRYLYYVRACSASGGTHTISYNAGGGTGTMSSNTGITDDGSQTLTTNTFTAPTNYSFAGWVADGAVTIGGDVKTAGTLIADGATITNITTDIALTAKWSQSVTLNANTSNHGSGDNGSATAYYNAAALSSITHTTAASGYKLSGYYTADTDGTKVLNSDGTFAGTSITGYISDGKWTQATSSSPTLYAQYESAGALTWNLGVNTSASSLTTDSKSSAFTEIAVANMTNAALTGIAYEASKKGSLTGKISTPASYDADDYVYVTFQVASGYKFTPSSVKVKAQPVTSAKSVKLVLEDENSHSINFTTASTISGGSTQTVEMTNGSSVYFEGTVTLKIYCYGATDKYRLGTPITIEGEIEEACATIPSYSSMSYTTTSFLPSADASGSPITIVGGTNIDTYQWKYNTVNDRTSGTDCGSDEASLTPLTDASATTDGTRYYWCEMTNDDCGITIKSPAVAITVAAAKSDATVTWTDPASTPNYGGGGYTIKATVDQSAWNGNAADLVITAPAGINIYNVSYGTDGSSRKYVQADFDVQTSFDRSTYASNIPFTVSAAATASYNAISDDHNTAYSACAGAGEGSSYNIRMRKTVTKDGNYYYSANTDGWISPNISSSHSTAKAGTTMATYFDTVASSNTQYVWVRTYHANVNKVRIYANFRANDMTVSNVYKHTDYFSADSKYAVDYTAVYNDDEENENTGTAAQGYVDITLDEVMAANDILLVKFNDSKVRPLGAVITEGSAGSLNTHLQWSGSLADGAEVDKNTTDAYFTYSASMITENTNSLGAITYSSSVPSVATVDATGKVAMVAAGSTTIKATLAASGCYKKAEISYTLNVTEVPCAITAGTLTLTSGTESKCSSDNVTLTLTGFESGASIQWKDGDTDINNGGNYTIATDGTTSTLTTDQEGTYSVMVTSGCSVRSNRITISNISTEVGAKRIVKNWYIKNGRLTPDIELWTLQNGAHLSSVAWSPTNTTGLTASDFYESDGKVYLKGKEPSSNTSGADIDYTLTLTVEDDCGSTTAMSASGQLIYLHHQKNTDKHVLAFVVTGTEKGGFTEGITAAQTTSVELYNTIAANFDVLATNVYSTDDEQALKEYYSQFDILCVTDYPDTGTKGVNKKSYVDALGALVDIRPILTMEAFVAKLANWKAKGISGTPQSPTTRQYTMLLQCKDHEIFAGTELTKVGEGEDEMYRVSMVCDTLEDYKTLDATYGAGTHESDKNYQYGKKPALQGFTFTAEMAEDDLLPLGLIDDGSGNDLQVGIERQTEMEARLMVLGINSYAMERLTDDGQTVVVNALKYLMKKNSEDIADCSNTFVGGAEGDETNWNNAANWSGNTVPDKTQKVRIVAPCVIMSGTKARVAGVIIAPNGKYNHDSDTATGSLTISAGAALIVDGKIQAVTAPAYSKTRPTSVGDIHIKATSEEGNGTLIFKNDEGTSQAIVEMYSKASFDGVSVSWQYIAVPFATTETAYENYYSSWLYRWAEDCSGWEVIPNRGDVGPWIGYCITQVGAKTYTMTGKLVETTTQEFSVPAGKEMVIGNSWTAPIQVKQFTDDDFGDLTKSIYLFNTGLDSTGTGTVNDVGVTGDARYAAGTYVTIPIHAASYTGDSLISSLQAFIVDNTDGGSAQTLTLDYDRHVRPTRATDKVNAGQMHAPVRRAVVADGEPEVLKLFVSGSRYDDRLVVLAREDFSAGFDNGWDGQNINEQGDAPMMYALREDGTRDAVSAVPEFEGTVVGFQAGEDDVYTMSFVYAEEAEPLYILDTDNETYTRVLTDNTYTFMTSDKDAHSRFVLTRTSGMRNPTGCENVDGSVKAKKFILNDKMYIMVNGVMYDATGKLVK